MKTERLLENRNLRFLFSWLLEVIGTRRRFLLALLLLLPAFCALDVQREAVHVISNSLEDNAVYTDVLYGDFASEAASIINTSSEFFYATATMPISIETVSANYTQDSVTVRAAGKHPSFITRLGGVLAFGTGVFEDAACASAAQSVRSTEQLTTTKIVVPENWSVITVPQNRSKQFKLMDFNFSAWTQESSLYESFYLKIKQNASLKEYCAERAQIEELLPQTFIVLVANKIEANLTDAVILLAVALILLYGLKYVMRPGR